jgi:hypothetical protein
MLLKLGFKKINNAVELDTNFKEKIWEYGKAPTAGFAAGGISATVVAPIDLVKHLKKANPKKYPHGTMKTIKQLYNQAGGGINGLRRLYRGNLATVQKLGISNAAAFAVYSNLMKQFNKQKNIK